MFSRLKIRKQRRVAAQKQICRASRRRLFHESLESRRLLTVLVEPIKDPNFPYVDANNDGLYAIADGDVLLDSGELDDGFFDTLIPEGNYTTVDEDAGLSIHGAAISSANIDFSANGNIVVNTNLTATLNKLGLDSREGSVLLDDPTLQAKNLLEILAAEDIISEDDHLITTGASSVIHLSAGYGIGLEGTSVEAKKLVHMEAEVIVIVPSESNPATVTATPNTIGKVHLEAMEGIFVGGTQIDARKDIEMEAPYLFVIESELTANGHGLGKIDLHGLVETDVSDSHIMARKTIEIEAYGAAGDGLIARGATIETSNGGATTVHLESHGEIDLQDANCLRHQPRVHRSTQR